MECKECKYWDVGAKSSVLGIEFHRCSHYFVFDTLPPPCGILVSAPHSCFTGPDFGCVNWEACEDLDMSGVAVTVRVNRDGAVHVENGAGKLVARIEGAVDNDATEHKE